MTAHEKKMRSDWAAFKSKNKNNKPQRIVLSKDEIRSVMSKIFR